MQFDRFVNLTGYPIRLEDGDRAVVVEPSGSLATVLVTEIKTWAVDVDGASYETHALTRRVHGLPEPVEGTAYIVNEPVLAEVNRDRFDVFAYRGTYLLGTDLYDDKGIPF